MQWNIILVMAVKVIKYWQVPHIQSENTFLCFECALANHTMMMCTPPHRTEQHTEIFLNV